ncbi:uncharacterized protein LOC132544685 [Ylistrum balloti]|uniref:uncharacterized protein LOC132544685 n=1 Tax=Ylistrum balloti TaxID=509963 RepID=UPI002905C046|nr:uncharacterized protein LOC132544685 [Ylistrum balloti]
MMVISKILQLDYVNVYISKMSQKKSYNGKHPQLLDFREVVGEHLYSKVLESCRNESHAQKVTGILLECGKEEAFRLLEDKDFLGSRIRLAENTLKECGSYINGNELVKALPASEILPLSVADKLFEKVSEIEPALSCQITGMLLEAESVEVEMMLQNSNILKQAVSQALLSLSATESEVAEEVSDNESDECSVSEDSIGDQLFEAVENIYPDPDTASKITGMLMESGSLGLDQLLQDKQNLTTRIHLAYKALQLKD